ncbi:MAG TPA: FtsX-like permease family protein [Acidobacteriaceae bacterium]|nr:FtsX-like permease family protein [Acidobacteriaceae bacterium]
MASLSYRSAAKIAAREMRSSRGKFLFVLLSVAIGVAALTGVRGFSSSFRATLLMRARSIMAADLAARMYQQPTPDQQQALDQLTTQGVQTTTVTEMLSMASSPKSLDPILVSLKAVDPALYPFYGDVDLSPAQSLRSALSPTSIAVGDDLLLRLNLHVGDSLKVGTSTFRIAASVVNEPDRLSGNFAAGPRVLITRAALASTGLLAPGNHATQRFLYKMPPPTDGRPVSDTAVAALKTKLVALLPEAQITDYRETNPALTEGLDRATSLLSLMSLVALVLGAVGVAMAMRAHLAQRLDTIAIMKSLGARSSQIIKIYVLQTLLLGLAGGTLGVLLGLAVQLAFPLVLGKLINVPTNLHLQPRAIFAGLGAGILTTLLFTLPPLLDIRNVKPSLILRRDTESDAPPQTQSLWRQFLNRLPWLLLATLFTAFTLKPERHHWPNHTLAFVLEYVALFAAAAFGPWLIRTARKNPAQLISFALILTGLALIATTLSDSREVGEAFSVGLVLVLLVLLAASSAVLAGLKFFLNRTRLHLPSPLRHGLANLYRPGNPSAALLAALGMGIMQIMTVYLVQRAVVTELHISSAPNLPNVFLIDIANPEIDGIRTLLKSQPSITAPPELVPIVSSRIEAIDGVPAAQAKLNNFPRRMLRSINLTWSDAPPPGTKILSGVWWSPNESKPQLAIAQDAADRIGVHLGSTITFAAQDTHIVATVVAITHADGQHAYGRANFTLNRRALTGLPIIWNGGIHVIPAQVAQLQRALYLAYPTVTVINVAQALETVRAVVIQISYVIQFLAGFSIFAGIIILASSIAGTRYRRIREVVVLKTLGATRARIATIFSIEFAILGLVAGTVGIVFANLIARTLLHQLHLDYHYQLPLNAAVLLGTAALTVATGWAASHRILGQKPLEVLREE